MAFYQFTRQQRIPAGVDEVWDFIKEPNNLNLITPPEMDFRVTGKSGNGLMYSGMIITYKVKPMLGISMQWVTEITHVVEKQYFVDEQRSGPYSFWHHQHRIETISGGVLMTDIVSYIPPLGIIGAIANRLFIQSKLNSIFNYRKTALENFFGSWDNAPE
ncbi:MAG: SRPBCC family protein [Saprospiraceae bacterium]